MTSPDETSSCPTSAELSAYVDGTADPEVRARVSRHLLTCDDCLQVIGEANRYRRLTRRPAISRRALALAASLIVGCFLGYLYVTQRHDPLAQLAETARGSGFRRFDGRLSRFDHAPYRAERASSPGAATPPAVAAAAQAVIADAASNSARDLHARGVAMLVIGRADDAVSLLERAAALQPSSSEMRNDLATARLTLGGARGDGVELRRAVVDAEAAHKLAPDALPPLFNVAVALDRLGDPAADAAYQQYLAADSRSGWADEARWRRAHLRK